MSNSSNKFNYLLDRIQLIKFNKNENSIPLKELLSIKIEIIEKLKNDKFLNLVDQRIDEKKKIMSEEQLNFKQALIYYEWGRFDLALEHFKKAFKLNPTKLDYLYYEKIVELDKILVNKKDNPMIYNEKGEFLTELNRFKDAYKCFEIAIELNCSTALYHFNKAKVLNKLNEFNLANDSYSIALELDSKNLEYLYMKEINLIDYEIHSNRRSLSKDQLYNIKGCFLIKLKQYKQAFIQFEKAIELNRLNADYHYHKGIALSEMYKYSIAEDSFNLAIELNPNNKDYFVYKEINNLNIRIKEDPNNGYLINRKGHFLFNLFDWASALACFNKAVELNPNVEIFILNRNHLLNEIKNNS